jgi:hypothetical protein
MGRKTRIFISIGVGALAGYAANLVLGWLGYGFSAAIAVAIYIYLE